MIEQGIFSMHQKVSVYWIDNLKEYRDKIREHI